MRNWNAAKVFSYKEIKAATNNFKEVIGRGSFGSVYLGKLPDGKLVALKVRFDKSQLGADSFINEVHYLTFFIFPYIGFMKKIDSCFLCIHLGYYHFLVMLPFFFFFPYCGLLLGLSIVTHSPSKSCMFGRILSGIKAANSSVWVSTWRIIGWSPLWYVLHDTYLGAALAFMRISCFHYWYYFQVQTAKKLH